MKRYYLSPLVTVQGPHGTVTQPKIATYGVSFAAAISPDDPANPGTPLLPWCLCVVDTKNHLPLLADTSLDALPDFPLDVKVASMNLATKNAMVRAMQRRGIDTAFIGNTDGFRDVIRAVGQTLHGTFDENNFDVTPGTDSV